MCLGVLILILVVGSVGVGDTDTDIFVLSLDMLGDYQNSMTISSDEGCDESSRDIYVGPIYTSDHHITGFIRVIVQSILVAQ